MNDQWRQFLLVLFPVTFFSIALAAEGIGYLLKDVPLRRHDLDRLVVALDRAEPLNAPIAIFGDSITQDVLKQYQLVSSDKMVNLTTNRASGVVGALFLLRRYLENNVMPKHIVIASTPEYFSYTPEGKAAEIYLTSVFQHDDEVAWLTDNMPSLNSEKQYEPVVMNLEGRIGYKLLALLAPSASSFIEGEPLPKKLPPVEHSSSSERVLKDISSRIRTSLSLSSDVEKVLVKMCRLVPDATFHFFVAPMPLSVHGAKVKSGEIKTLISMLESSVGEECGSVYVDLNRNDTFPDHAMRDADHLKRPGWTAVYAKLLKDELERL